MQGRPRSKLQPPLNAGVVEHTVEDREFRHNFSGDFPNRRGITHVEHEVTHSGICRADLLEAVLPAATDDDLISHLMKCLCQTPADPRTAAGYADGVIANLHFFTSQPGGWRDCLLIGESQWKRVSFLEGGNPLRAREQIHCREW